MKAKLAGLNGLPLTLDEVLRSAVYSPADVPYRNSRREVTQMVDAIMTQYESLDTEDEDRDEMVEQMKLERRMKGVGDQVRPRA